MYQDLLIDEDQGWLCRWFQCHGRPTEMKTQKLLTWSYDDGFPIIRENSRSLSFKKFWVFLPWQRRCHQSREVWWLWVGPEVFWNLEEKTSWNQQIEIFKTGQLENCHGCPFYHAEEGSAINKIISNLNCIASWFFCQRCSRYQFRPFNKQDALFIYHFFHPHLFKQFSGQFIQHSTLFTVQSLKQPATS